MSAADDLLDQMRGKSRVGDVCAVGRAGLPPDVLHAIALASAERLGATAVYGVITEHLGGAPKFGPGALETHMRCRCRCPKP